MVPLRHGYCPSPAWKMLPENDGLPPKDSWDYSSQGGIVAGEWGWGERHTHKREVYIQKKSVEAGEIVQWVRTLSALPEDLDSNPSSFLVAGYLSSVTLVP